MKTDHTPATFDLFEKLAKEFNPNKTPEKGLDLLHLCQMNHKIILESLDRVEDYVFSLDFITFELRPYGTLDVELNIRVTGKPSYLQQIGDYDRPDEWSDYELECVEIEKVTVWKEGEEFPIKLANMAEANNYLTKLM